MDDDEPRLIRPSERCDTTLWLYAAGAVFVVAAFVLTVLSGFVGDENANLAPAADTPTPYVQVVRADGPNLRAEKP